MKLGHIIKVSLVAFVCAASAVSAQTYELVSRNAAVTASTSESSQYAPANLTDGNEGTRWASAFADNQELVIDLGKREYVDKIVLKWEAAYATSYTIRFSNEVGSWSGQRIHYQHNGVGGVETIDRDLGQYRYIKIELNTRATAYGFSLFEVEVYKNLDLRKTARTLDLQQYSDWGGVPKPECTRENTGTIVAEWEGHYFNKTSIYACLHTTLPNNGGTVYGWVPMASGSQLIQQD